MTFDKIKWQRDKYHNDPKYRKKRIESAKKRIQQRKDDPIFILRNLTNSRIYDVLKSAKVKRLAPQNMLLGIDYKKYKKYLESKFKKGMNWNNQGYFGWNIDHIRPIYSFDLTTIKGQMEAFNYKNCQPIWFEDHKIKSTKYIRKLEEQNKKYGLYYKQMPKLLKKYNNEERKYTWEEVCKMCRQIYKDTKKKII